MSTSASFELRFEMQFRKLPFSQYSRIICGENLFTAYPYMLNHLSLSLGCKIMKYLECYDRINNVKIRVFNNTFIDSTLLQLYLIIMVNLGTAKPRPFASVQYCPQSITLSIIANISYFIFVFHNLSVPTIQFDTALSRGDIDLLI